MMSLPRSRSVVAAIALAVACPFAAALAMVSSGPHGVPQVYVAPQAAQLEIDTVVLARLLAAARTTDFSFSSTGRKIRIEYKSPDLRVASLSPITDILPAQPAVSAPPKLSHLPVLKPRRVAKPVIKVASLAPGRERIMTDDRPVITLPVRKIARLAPLALDTPAIVVQPAAVQRAKPSALYPTLTLRHPEKNAPAKIKVASLAPVAVAAEPDMTPLVALPTRKISRLASLDLETSASVKLPELPRRATRRARYPSLALRHPEKKQPNTVRVASLGNASVRDDTTIGNAMPNVPRRGLPPASQEDAYIPWAVRQEQARAPRTGPVHGNPHLAPHLAPFVSSHRPGTVVVHVKEKRLYLVQSSTTALVYPIGTARGALDVLGKTRITTRRFMPTWTPTPNQRRRDPTLPRRVEAGPNNPLGIRAMGIGWRYRLIHGTSDPASIGFARSDGCIRMLNDDVADLFNRVKVGDPVLVLASASAPLTEWRPAGYREYKPLRKRWRRKAWRKKRYVSRLGNKRRRKR